MDEQTIMLLARRGPADKKPEAAGTARDGVGALLTRSGR